MTSNEPVGAVGQALVDFTTNGAFPEEDVSSLKLSSGELSPAVQALAEAKSKLETEIHSINEETAPDVSSWMANAQSVQDDINRSKRLANDIVRQAEEPVLSGAAIQEAEDKFVFLQAEIAYNQRVQEALRGIKDVNQILDQVERARDERRILDALHLLERSWVALDALPAGQGVRVRRLLDLRAFELKSNVHDVFDHVWKTLMKVDTTAKTISFSAKAENEAMSLSDAVIGLQAYKEVDQRMAQLWHDIDQAIIGPRMDIDHPGTPAVTVDGEILRAEGQADKSIDSLFQDLDRVFSYFAERLPQGLIESLSALMMPEIVSRVITVWLDSAVPASLQEMDKFETIMATTRRFCARLAELKFSGFNELQEWVENAPRVWLTKCRETALDTVRTRLSEGLGSPKQVERVEKQMVSRAEGQGLVAAPATAAAAAADDDDWGAAWDDGGDEPGEATEQPEQANTNEAAAGAEEDGADAWGWGEEGEAGTQEAPETQPQPQRSTADDDDAGEAWGWGDEDTQEEQPERVAARRPSSAPNARGQREMTLKETYNISSMPEPVLQLIFAILEDGATLTQAGPVATAAAGLFSLPTLALAMFRAVGPYYYALDIGGNMFLYNDANYLAERLADFAAAWKKRDGLSTRAQNSLRLDNDVKTLQSFAARAYGNEMGIQKTVLRDLLGGEQSLLQQDDIDSCVDATVARVRSMAVTWETILARSAWYQAVGSLVDAISLKIIADVMEAPSVSQDDAYNIAKLIATVTELDDLFLPSRVTGKRLPNAGEEVPQTTQYAPTWMRLKYLSEVLQSNLRDVRFLWMESELSLYFTVDEVVDLINLSFEDNARTRETIREIRSNPQPRQDEQGDW
ncbi:centromere kinetochore protein [Diaporthe amygdali]|uniref:centromere kinetochore protein n=1 Tax=Phomopsis amygdali TaxID=1214568 RepID=UPI0022FEA718|nr:centromere kinetochore protein [Diaporthe amygdali]KAJ0117044.1 centromere kinetochore protein [Diaporthe amygdali]